MNLSSRLRALCVVASVHLAACVAEVNDPHGENELVDPGTPGVDGPETRNEPPNSGELLPGEETPGEEVPPGEDRFPSNDDTLCDPSGGSGGLAPGVHETLVAGLQAQVIVGDGYDPSKPTYLAFWLHGDGGNYRTRNEALSFVRRNGWILVGAQAPNPEHIWWDRTLWDGEDYVQLFKNVLDEMFRKYNVCRKTLFGAGGSGGPYFWTQSFFPALGESYPAHFVGLCGGGTPGRNRIAALGQKSDVVARSSFDFICGDADRLFPHSVDANDDYGAVGFHSTLTRLAGAGHCNVWVDQGFPSVPARMAERWTKFATRLGILLK